MDIGYKLSPQQSILRKLNGMQAPCSIAISFRGVVQRFEFEKAVQHVVEDEEAFKLVIDERSDKTFQRLSSQLGYVIEYGVPSKTLNEEESTSQLHTAVLPKVDCRNEVKLVIQVNQFEALATLIFCSPCANVDIKSLHECIRRIFNHYQNRPQKIPKAVTYLQYAEWTSTIEVPHSANMFWEEQLKLMRSAPKLTFHTAPHTDIRSISLRSCLIDGLGELMKKPSELESLFLGNWLLLLWLLSDRQQACIGYYSGERDFPELNDCIGAYGRILPFSVPISPAEQLNDITVKVAAHRELVEQQKMFLPADQLDHICYGFEFLNMPPVQDPRLSIISSVNIDGLHDLKLTVILEETAVQIKLSCEQGSFSIPDCDYVLELFKFLVGRALTDPHTVVGQLVKDFSSEKRQYRLFQDDLLKVSGPAFRSVVTAFAEQVLHHGNDTALVIFERKISYTSLNEDCQKIASFLRDSGITRGSRVAILTEFPLNMVRASLAVLQAGGCYVPLDNKNPQARNAIILSDCNAAILLLDDSLVGKSGADGVKEYSIEQILASSDKIAAQDACVLQGDDPAYIMYTSGTTGRPKGAIIPHRSLSNYVSWLRNEFLISFTDRTVLLSSLAFDLSYTGYWGSLLSGGSIYLIDEELVRNPDELLEYIRASKITFLKTTPTQFALLAHSTEREKIAECDLRLIILGGERIRVGDIQKWLADKGTTEFVNHYGPTETTVGVVFERISKKNFEYYSRRPVIGRPIPNNRIYILGEDNQLQPPGFIGEIVIAGRSVGNGYNNEPELTRAKFFEDPFVPGERVYRTGDLGVCTPDQKILFCGRHDRQVKIRGHRVELTEIEAAMSEVPNVISCVTLVTESQNFGNELCAFIVARDNISDEQIWAYIKPKLPDYMWPTQICIVKQIPFTRNGKVDTAALIQQLSLARTVKNDEPSDLLQAKLLDIWRNVLGRSDFGIDDSFFNLGGHSLKAIKIAAAIYKELNYKVNVRSIFLKPTVRSLSQAIAADTPESYKPIPKAPLQDHYPLSYPQQRLWILSQFKGGSEAYNMTFPLFLPDAFEVSLLEAAIFKILERHEILRTGFVLIGDEPRQQIVETDQLIFRIEQVNLYDADLKSATSEMIRSEMLTPFELSRPPLFRVKSLYAKGKQRVLVFTIHHIITDAWSRRIFAEELEYLLEELGKNSAASGLPPAKLQYKDFTCWMIEELKRPALQKQRMFWLKLFSYGVPVLQLPTDFSRLNHQAFAGRTIRGFIDREILLSIREFARIHQTTAFTVLLSVYKLLLFRQTGQVNILVGSPVAAREHADLKDVMGMFTNLVALWTKIDVNWTFSELVSVVKETTSRAFANQEYPFDQLVQDLHMERQESGLSFVEVGFTWNGEERTTNKSAYQEIEIEMPSATSKLELWLYAYEMDDRISLILEYNSSLFKEERMRMFFESFKIILFQAMLNPSQKSSALIKQPEADVAPEAKVKIKLNL